MKIRVLLFFFLLSTIGFSQDEDLLKLAGEDTIKKEYVSSAFKSSRVIMSHSIEMLNSGVLDFRILHRFGRINGGLYELFGLDGPANVRLGLDYALSNNVTIGLGRSTHLKELDGFLKIRFLQQSTGLQKTPFSLVGVAGSTIRTARWTDGLNHSFSERISSYGQLLIGRKLSDGFTLQLAPTLLYRNKVDSIGDNPTTTATGIGARIRLSRRISLNFDYYFVFNKEQDRGLKNPLSIGFDIETGGHVFQLHFTNAHGMNERAFLTETLNSWSKGDIQFGFNISRVFQLKKKKDFE